MKTREIQTPSLQKDYSIESSIANEEKLAKLARRLEALETKEPSPVNQVSPNQFPTMGYTYCQAMNYLFEECHVSQAQQHSPELMNAAFSRLNNNPYTPTYNLGWRNHPNFSWSKNNNDHSWSNHASHFHHANNSSNHQLNFSNFQHNSPNHPPNFSIY